MYRRNVAVLTGVAIGALTGVPVCKVKALTANTRVAGARLDDDDLTGHPSEAGTADAPEACQKVQALTTIKARVTYARKGYDRVTVLTSETCVADASVGTHLVEALSVDAGVTGARLRYDHLAVDTGETNVTNT